MSKFKVGDRVAYYGCKRFTAVIDTVDSDGILRTVSEKTKSIAWVHPKQCRRLVKKPKREWWLVVSRVNELWVFADKKEAQQQLEEWEETIPCDAPYKLVNVREVVKK